MSTIRDEIRTILREELAVLRSEIIPNIETVSITSSEELNRFAQDILARAEGNNDFVARLNSGQIKFALRARQVKEALSQATPRIPIVSSPVKSAGVTLDKALVTERDIIELDTTIRMIRLPLQSRLTPLAKDEARRKGIRIERVET